MIMKFQQRMVMGVICASFFQTLIPVESLPVAHKIKSLPGQPQVSFQQFAGFITIDKQQQRALFYYFVEAEGNPSSKPLVLWLNGGPGCSSIGAGAFIQHGPFRPSGYNLVKNEYSWNKGPGCSSIGAGAFVEHGPFRPSGNNLVKNEYSWNKEANMLYLESPAGVGFSYSSNKSFYSYVDDEITAQDSLLFLKLWFAKFPEYQNRDFFIAGESYAGHYVPQLAHLIVQSNVKFKLKGIAIGNPLLEFATDFNAPDEYYWSHGLISDAVYSLLSKYCNSSQIMREAINGFLSPACAAVDTQLSGELSQSIDPYYVIGDVCVQSPGQSQVETLYHPLKARVETLSYFHSLSDASSQQPVRQSKEDVCAQENTAKYLNRKDVQQALHARLVGVPRWVLCSKVPNYDVRDREIPTIPVVGSLVRSGIRALVYSGDQDSIVPFTGTRTLVHRLARKLGLNTTVPYRAWFEGKQVGGWTQVYGKMELSFASIRGGSHTAPASQPERSLTLFKGFIAGKALPAT